MLRKWWTGYTKIRIVVQGNSVRFVDFPEAVSVHVSNDSDIECW